MKKKVKRKLSFKGLLVVILGIYLLCMVVYVIYKMPVKLIIVKGNTLTSENEILEASNISKGTSIWSLIGKKNKIKSLDYVNDAKIKFNLLGKVTIDIDEARILYAYEDEYVLSNGKKIVPKTKVLGIPTLINFCPSEVENRFIDRLKTIDSAVLKMVSEIKYDPDINGEITLDSERFLLKMNDENSVYINIVNIQKLNRYKEIIATLKAEEKGVLYLDSNSSNTYFETYDKILSDREEKEKEAEANELPNETAGDSE